MSKTISIPKALDLKYASLWHDVDDDKKVPALLKPMDYYKPLNKRDKQLYHAGAWAVLNEMADDGLIKQETLRKIHDKNNGWVERSQITVGKAPVVLWLEIGFIIGALLAGGVQLIVWIVEKVI